MGWSGRAPALPASEASNAMFQKLNTAIAVIGIDIGKNSFHIVALYKNRTYRVLSTHSNTGVVHGFA